MVGQPEFQFPTLCPLPLWNLISWYLRNLPPGGGAVLPDPLMSITALWGAVASSMSGCDVSRHWNCVSVTQLDRLHVCSRPRKWLPGQPLAEHEELYRADPRWWDYPTAWNQAKLIQQSPPEPQPPGRPGRKKSFVSSKDLVEVCMLHSLIAGVSDWYRWKDESVSSPTAF